MSDNYEANTNLRELCLRVVAHRKLLIIFSLIFALAFAVRTAFHVKVTSNYEEGKSMISEEEYEEKLERYNLMREQYNAMIGDVQSQIEVKKDYLDNSILMSIDPYREIRATFQLQVVSSNGAAITQQNIRTSLANRYDQFVVNGSGWSEVSKELGVKEGYLRETCETTVDTANCIVNVTIKDKDEESAEKTLELIVEKIKDYYENESEGVSPHILYISNENISSALDNDLITVQTSKKNELNSLKQNIINYNNSLNNLSKPDAEKVIHESRIRAGKKDIIKGFAEGFVLGLVLAVMAVCVYLIYGDFVLSASEMERKFGIFSLDASKDTDMLSYRIFSFHPEMKKLVIVGTVSEKNSGRLEEIKKALMDRFEVSEIKGERESLPENRILSAADAVVILSETERTRYRDIKAQIEMADEWKKDVVGIVNF